MSGTSGEIRCSSVFLRDILMMPSGWEICSIEWKHNLGELRIHVRGDNVPAGFEGEIRGEYGRNDDGSVFVLWKPQPEPGPSMFMRMVGTDACFWCGQAEGEHGPDRVCRDQTLAHAQAVLNRSR